MRNAVLLIAGDKSGRRKERYAEAIPVPEAAYEDSYAITEAFRS